MHARQQIRDALVGALAGLSVGANIFASRLVPLNESQLPALLIATESEDIAGADIGDTLERRLDIVIRIAARAPDDIDDDLDSIAEEVETRLAGNTLGGLLSAFYLTSHRVEFEQLDQPVGIAEMRYQAIYYTTAGAPGAVL